MDKISIIAIVIAQIVVVICVLVVFLQRRSMKNLIENLTTMIDDATKGTLKSKRPDGSVFSDLEVKMNQYLKICIVRNRRAKEKKDRIKSLIAEVAFQTQAPLADVKMYSDMLVEQKDLSDDSRKIAERISAQGERLNMMLEAVVRISVLESGLNSIEPKSQNLGNHWQRKKELQFNIRKRRFRRCLIIRGRSWRFRIFWKMQLSIQNRIPWSK